ncbi:MAG: hypothetical protein KDD99_31260, partial [Bacteroidetes bacterium]|nr:hypothetical protein [Bacteroidota bacterium]
MKWIIFVLITLLHTGLFAQQFQWVNQWSGFSEEVATNIAVDHAGNQYVSGYFGNTINFAADTFTSLGFRDAVVAKYTPSGQEVWALQLGSVLDDEAVDIGMDDQANIYVLLNHNDSIHIQNQIIFSDSYWSVLKFDQGGNLLDHFNPFVAIPTFFSLEDMAISPQGKIALTGSFGLATSSTPYQLQIGITTLFTAQRMNGQYVQQMWTAVFDHNGQYLWSKATHATGNIGATGARVTFGKNEELFVGGVFSPDFLQGPDIDFGPSTTSLTSPQGRGVFVARFSATGSFLWADAINATSILTPPGEVSLTALHWGTDDALYVAGNFLGEMIFGVDTISTPSAMFLPAIWPYLARFKQNQPHWAQLFAGSQFLVHSLTSIASSDDGQIYAGGVLGDSLIVGSQIATGA